MIQEYTFWIAIGSIASPIVTFVLFLMIRRSVKAQESTARTQRDLIKEYRETKKHQQKKILAENFFSVTNHVGDDNVRKYRQLLYTKSGHMKEILTDMRHYNNNRRKTEPEVYEYAKAVRELTDIYSRVSFLLQQDGTFREKFLSWHGYTMGHVYIIMWAYMTKRKDQIVGQTNAYDFFEEMFCNHIAPAFGNSILENLRKGDLTVYDYNAEAIEFQNINSLREFCQKDLECKCDKT